MSNCINAINNFCFYGKQIDFTDKTSVEHLKLRLLGELQICNNPNIEFLKYLLIYVDQVLYHFALEDLNAFSFMNIQVEMDNSYIDRKEFLEWEHKLYCPESLPDFDIDVDLINEKNE